MVHVRGERERESREMMVYARGLAYKNLRTNAPCIVEEAWNTSTSCQMKRKE